MQSFKQIMGLNETSLTVGDGGLTEINFTSTLRDYYNGLEAASVFYNNTIIKALDDQTLTTEETTNISSQVNIINSLKNKMLSNSPVSEVGQSLVSELQNQLFNSIVSAKVGSLTFQKIYNYSIPMLPSSLLAENVDYYRQLHNISIDLIAYSDDLSEKYNSTLDISLNNIVMDSTSGSSIDVISGPTKNVINAGNISADVSATYSPETKALEINVKSYNDLNSDPWKIEQSEDLSVLDSSVIRPSPRYDHFQVNIGNKMYILNGKNASDTPLDEMWEYDLATKEWTKKNGPAVTSTTTLIYFAANGILFAATAVQYTTVVYMYDSVNDFWETKVNKYSKHYDASASNYRPSMYYDPIINEVYLKNHNYANSTYSDINSTVVKISFPSNVPTFDITTLHHGTYNAFDLNGENILNLTYNGRRVGLGNDTVYDINGNHATSLDIDIFTSGILFDEFMYLYAPQVTRGGNLWRYNFETDAIEEASAEALNRYNSRMILWNGRGYVFGGKIDTTIDGIGDKVTNEMQSYKFDTSDNAMNWTVNISDSILPQSLILK